jgi:type VII secretion integral membrane protein EccD
VSENSLEPGAGQDRAEFNDAGQEPLADVAQALADGTPPADTESPPERPPAGVDDLCRLNVCGPSRSVELAVPVHVPLIDLLPAMVGHLGDNLADTGLDHGGWVLQRLGDPPLREDLSVAVLGLHDGDTVHLRPRADQLPPLDFDDLIDGIAVGISGRSDRWRPEMSRRLLTGLLAVPLAAGLVLLVGRPGPFADALAALTAVILLALTAAASRAFANLSMAGILAAAAIGYAAVAGGEFTLLSTLAEAARAPHSPGTAAATLPVGWTVLRPALLASGGSAAAVSAVLTGAIGGRHPAIVGTTATAILVTAAAVLAVAGRLSAAATAGLVLVLVLPFSGWIPVLSFRLAGLRLDPLPTTPDELQADLDPLPGQHLVERTRWTDRYQNALYCGLGVVVMGCLIPVGVTPGWPARLVALDAAILMLLHARALVGVRQRLALILPAVGGLAVLAVAAGLGMPRNSWAGVFAGLVLAGGALLTLEQITPGRKVVPHWGWAGDMLQSLTAVALFPLVLWMLNVYHYARGIHV